MKKFIAVIMLSLALSSSAFSMSIPHRHHEKATERTKFWDRETKTEAVILTGAGILDLRSTVKMTRAGCDELNPFTRLFVTHGTPATAAAFAIEGGVVIGSSYLAYRMHHRRISKWILRVAVLTEGYNSIREARMAGAV